MKYWREQDFQNLEVEVPEAHRRLIQKMVTKLRTPEVKSGGNRSHFTASLRKVQEKVPLIQEENFQRHLKANHRLPEAKFLVSFPTLKGITPYRYGKLSPVYHKQTFQDKI